MVTCLWFKELILLCVVKLHWLESLDNTCTCKLSQFFFITVIKWVIYGMCLYEKALGFCILQRGWSLLLWEQRGGASVLIWIFRSDVSFWRKKTKSDEAFCADCENDGTNWKLHVVWRPFKLRPKILSSYLKVRYQLTYVH